MATKTGMSKIKKSALTITTYADRPVEFWQDMGPFFARREVRREMPYLVDDDGYVWFVARLGGVVVGFVSYVVTKGGVANIHGLYVVPTHRDQGIAENLLGQMMDALAKSGAKIACATCTNKSVDLFLKNGFENTGTKGNQYTVVEMEL